MLDMPNSDFDPMKLAALDSGFRFPPNMPTNLDQAGVEMRMLLTSWLRIAQDIISANGGLQEFRDALQRATEITVALSAHQIRLHKAKVDVSPDAGAPGANGHDRPRRQKANGKGATKAPVRAKAKSRHAAASPAHTPETH